MIFEEKKITLKKGRIAVLKSPDVEDSEKMLNYIKKACGETDFLARYPEEWNISVEQEAGWIGRMRNSPDAIAITCYVDGTVAGNCEITFKNGLKISHRAGIGIAILKEYWNLGIGTAMFEELIAEAEKHGTEILELEFIEGNERGRALYEKFGFETVCTRPRGVKLRDGTYRSEIFMQKYLK